MGERIADYRYAMLPCLPFLSKECSGSSAGTGAGLGAHFLWGFAVLFWPLFTGMDPVSIMSHRMIWTVAFLGVVLWATGHLHTVREGFRSKRTLAALLLAALLLPGPLDRHLAPAGELLAPLSLRHEGHFLKKLYDDVVCHNETILECSIFT